jgi:hypothetical protein
MSDPILPAPRISTECIGEIILSVYWNKRGIRGTSRPSRKLAQTDRVTACSRIAWMSPPQRILPLGKSHSSRLGPNGRRRPSYLVLSLLGN